MTQGRIPTDPTLSTPLAIPGRARKRRPAALLASFFLLCSATYLPGCAEVSSQVRPATEGDGLVIARETKRSILWVRPDHHLGRYDSVLVNVDGFMYGKGQDALSYAQEDRIEEMLEHSFARVTSSGPVSNAVEPGACTLAINIGLKDLRLHQSDHTGSNASFVSSFGSVTMVVELRDSLTETPLLRYMENQGLGGGRAGGRMGADLARLGGTLGDLLQNTITELQAIVPTTTGVRPHNCNGGIYALTGRSQGLSSLWTNMYFSTLSTSPDR